MLDTRMPAEQRVHAERHVDITPSELAERRFGEWQGLTADVVEVQERTPFDYRFRSDRHLLVASEHSERDDGETQVEGLPKSTLRNITGRLTFVPAGHDFHGWQHPRVLLRATYLYIDPNGPLLDEALGFSTIEFQPRLFFFDAEIWRITSKLKTEAVNGDPMPHYGEALSVLLGHELIRLNDGTAPRAATITRGGLSGWQQKRVAEFIEDHLAEEVRLTALADLVDLSPYHFARAFKQSFGVPPHRYHVSRRIARAKELLAAPTSSVTDVALAVGFAETSSFSAAFRKTTGYAPSEYRRGLA